MNLDGSSTLYRSYLLYILESIVNKGDATHRKDDRQKEIDLCAGGIIPLLKPLAFLLSKNNSLGEIPDGLSEHEDIIPSLVRDAWFNIAVHGISLASEIGQQCYQDLRVFAVHSPPLVAENRAELLESDIELNTILRRGISTHHTMERKKSLAAEIPDHEADIRRLSYPKSIFLNAALLVESLRATSGDCTKVLTYFLDPALNSSEMGNCMRAIADKAVAIYLDKSVSGNLTKFSAPYISNQLADIFVACCHRIEKVQQVATTIASKIISQCPSSLCEKRSLFVLLDLLTVMWSSCLDEELDEFEWKSVFTSARNVKIELSDNYDFRKRTLSSFYKLARTWISNVMNIAPLDVKGLLQVWGKFLEFSD